MDSKKFNLLSSRELFTEKKLFSVVIPCHNESKYINRLLDALENQTYPISMYEVIVVDNCSSDNTTELIWEFAQKTKIQLRLHHEYKLGVSYARNSGAKNSIGETIIFLDADNLVEPVFLENLSRMITTRGCIAGTFRTLPDSAVLKGSLVFWSLELIKSSIPRPFGKSFVRRDIFNCVKGFNPNIVLGENMEFLSRVKKQVEVNFEIFSHVNKPIYCSLRRFEKEGYLRVLLPWLLCYLGVKNFKYRTMFDLEKNE